jgi:hypothetical protein
MTLYTYIPPVSNILLLSSSEECGADGSPRRHFLFEVGVLGRLKGFEYDPTVVGIPLDSRTWRGAAEDL